MRVVNGTALAPINLALPSYVRGRLGRRPEYVLEHGFEDQSIGIDWWNAQLTGHGLDQRVRLFDHDEAKRLTRRDLFEVAQPAANPNATDGEVLTLLWHVLAWGTGSSQRGNVKRIDAFTDAAARRRNVDLLKGAIAFAREGDPGSAYGVLIRHGGGQIRGLGPAFFTKLLYFASEDAAGTRCLILDARVAKRLSQAGWTSLPGSGRNRYSYNWFTATYTSYCELLMRWAAEESDRQGRQIWPDEIERALFEGEAAR